MLGVAAVKVSSARLLLQLETRERKAVSKSKLLCIARDDPAAKWHLSCRHTRGRH